jgi:para-aminobenzoate synthetase component 1
VPEIMFGFYDCAVIVDHWKKEVNVFSSGFPEKGGRRSIRARARMDAIMLKLAAGPQESRDRQRDPGLSKKISSNFSKERYLAVIRKAKDYIARGDIYQVNLSQRFATRSNIEDWRLYQRLVKNFPVCFSGFFKTKDFSILSASPERFLNFDGRAVTTRPMKGTRRRTQDPLLNKKLKEELSLSKKEKAELLMIVDLERNDLGRVCAYGSVKVNRLRQIEAYKGVFQATAEVEGLLHKGMDRIDLLRACFPGGSVTGCPKIRSMEIIEELEPEARSIYTGALGFLSFHNTMEFNVLIRSFLKKKDEVSFHAGGGIVTDSEPEAEYEETLIKAKALFEALTGEKKDGSGLAR